MLGPCPTSRRGPPEAVLLRARLVIEATACNNIAVGDRHQLLITPLWYSGILISRRLPLPRAQHTVTQNPGLMFQPVIRDQKAERRPFT